MRESLILTYHSLDDSGSVLSLGPEVFSKQMERLAALGMDVVPLSEVMNSPGAAALTFDDGFTSFREHALPALQRHGFPATVFVVPDRCGGTNDWDQKGIAGLPALEVMSWSDLQEMAEAGVELGTHTMSHSDLTKLDEFRVMDELNSSKKELEDRTGQRVESLAYPYGRSNEFVRRIAAQRFQLACGTHLDYLSVRSDPFDLPRVDVFYLRDLTRFEGVVTGRDANWLRLRRTLRGLRARVKSMA